MEHNHSQKKHIGRNVWMRGLYMLLLLICFGVAEVTRYVSAFMQFGWLVFTGAPNDFLRRVGVFLSGWTADTVRFLICVSEDKPFPWRDWPSGKEAD